MVQIHPAVLLDSTNKATSEVALFIFMTQPEPKIHYGAALTN